MRLKLDENLGRRHLEMLVAAGHEVDDVRSEGLSGAPDPEVLQAAVADGRALVTLDLDFADPWRFPPGPTSGIVVLRVRSSPGRRDIDPLVERLVLVLETNAITGHLWVVDAGRVRRFTRHGTAND